MKIRTAVSFLMLFLSSLCIQVPVSSSVSVSDSTANADYLLTESNKEDELQATLQYLNPEHITVKNIIHEIGRTETETPSKAEQQKIQDNTPSTVQKTTKNATYQESTLGSAPLWPRQWNMQKLITDAHRISNDKLHDIKIGVIDSGISSHYLRMLGSKVRYIENFVPKGGFNQMENDETGDKRDVEDRKGHGTSVTSLILGTDQMQGIAPDVQVDEYRVFSRKGCSPTWVLQALVKAVENGDDIINMSLGRYGIINGGYGNSNINDFSEYEAWTRAVEYAKQKGSLVVVASGNEGLNLDNSQEIVDYINRKNPQLMAHGEGKSLPGSIPGVIQVGATGADGQRAEFSCYSSNTIYAPGGDIRKTGLRYPNMNLVPHEWIMTFGGRNNQDYSYGIGTSFAAPEVSGMLAHLIVQNQSYKQPEKTKDSLSKILQINNGLAHLTLDNILKLKVLNISQDQKPLWCQQQVS